MLKPEWVEPLNEITLMLGSIIAENCSSKFIILSATVMQITNIDFINRTG